MNWKTDLRLTDLPPQTAIECTCRACRLAWYMTADELLVDPNHYHMHLDELEQDLRCRLRGCGGRVRIALIHDDLNEAFVGGLA